LSPYLLLMRHGRRVNVDSADEDDAAAGERDAGIYGVSALSRRGARETREVAEGLKEYILESGGTPNQLHFRSILIADTLPARATFALLSHRLPIEACEQTKVRRTRVLDPSCLSPYLAPKHRADLIEALGKRLEKLLLDSESTGEGGAVLVVGHQPQLTWLVGELNRRRRPIRRILHLDAMAARLPSLARSEVACLRQDSPLLGPKRWSLLWTISPTDKETLKDLREKVKSKMDVAKVLGGFIAAALTFFLNSLLGDVTLGDVEASEALRLGAAACFFTAVVLYLATMYFYDRLLMPLRFWEENRPNASAPRWLVCRPPGSAIWIIYQNMLRIWRRLFLPATVLVVLGIGLVAVALLNPGKQLLAIGGVAAMLLVVLCAYLILSRPRLGVQD
jgi:phosphohistidine phosphatase SixA